MSQTQTIGVIGAGLMGLGMTKRLIAKGYRVLVRDIDPVREQLAREAGAQIARSPREVGEHAAITLIAVLDASQIEQVLEGSNGLLIGLDINPTGDGGLPIAVLMCSTIAPTDVERFSQSIMGVGAWPIDAPISGGPVKAALGTMSMMLAGDVVGLNFIRPVTQALSGRQFEVSNQVGDAMRAKLVNNMMAAAHLVAASEAMGLAASMGLDLNKMAQIAAASSGQSWMCDDRVARALNDDETVAAQMHVLTKDVRLAALEAERLNIIVPIGKHAATTMQAACDAGYKYQDDSLMFQYWAGLIEKQGSE
jgi:L-threonate 2-dehydrogenase